MPFSFSHTLENAFQISGEDVNLTAPTSEAEMGWDAVVFAHGQVSNVFPVCNVSI
jgi:hypothetical protein